MIEPYYLPINEPCAEKSKREFDCVWGSGQTVLQRWKYSGELYHCQIPMSTDSIRLDFMNSGSCPLTLGHRGEEIGVVVENSAYIQSLEGRCRIRFNKSYQGEKAFQDVKTRKLTKLSIGYRRFDFIELEGKRGGYSKVMDTELEIYELSLVPQGADTSARILF